MFNEHLLCAGCHIGIEDTKKDQHVFILLGFLRLDHEHVLGSQGMLYEENCILVFLLSCAISSS